MAAAQGLLAEYEAALGREAAARQAALAALVAEQASQVRNRRNRRSSSGLLQHALSTAAVEEKPGKGGGPWCRVGRT